MFAFGAEESHGYLVGQYARDKDGPVAAMLAAEMVAETKAAGMTLRQRLEGLFAKYGYHAEKTISVYKRGESGMEEMLAVMDHLLMILLLENLPTQVQAQLKLEIILLEELVLLFLLVILRSIQVNSQVYTGKQ